jgi:hypothetical protein
MSTGYRRLPGRRRGLLKGASAWVADDHILAVHSVRFREEYKRYYLGDVQAIVIASAPRFLVSTRAIAGAFVWVVACAFAWLRWDAAMPVFWIGIAVALCAWLYISAARSCTCRIYTAVSRDELPSVYRRWTARRFLAEVEPRIAAVQGGLEGNWAESLETRDVGPPDPARSRLALSAPGERKTWRSRTLASDIFIATLFADALLNWLGARYEAASYRWATMFVNLVEIAGVILIFVQHRHGQLGSRMRKVAISTVIALGVLYSANSGINSTGSTASPLPMSPVAHYVDLTVKIALGLAGVFVAVTREHKLS